MEYKELHALSTRLNEALRLYVIEQDEINAHYYIAKNILDELHEKSYKNAELRSLFGQWLLKGSTVRLKYLMQYVDFDDRCLAHSNALYLIDSVRANF